jgi:hypothetical protein
MHTFFNVGPVMDGRTRSEAAMKTVCRGPALRPASDWRAWLGAALERAGHRLQRVGPKGSVDPGRMGAPIT